MVNAWDKFLLLLWKNWTLQKRHKIQTAVEILVPVLFSTLLVLVRSLVEPVMMGAIQFPQFSASNSSLNISQFWDNSSSSEEGELTFNFSIPYSPDTSLAHDVILNSSIDLIIDNVRDEIPGIPKIVIRWKIKEYLIKNNKLMPFPNSSALWNHMSSPLYNPDNSVCGISLDGLLPDGLANNIGITLHFPSELRTMPPRSRYKNWFTDFAFNVFQVPGPVRPSRFRGGIPSYSDEGFSQIAHSLMRRIIMHREGISLKAFPEIMLQRLPHPAYVDDPLILVLKAFLPLIIMLSFVYTCINTVKAIAAEKEQQLKEVMKVMGLDSWLHWTAWFVKSFSYIIIAVILIVILLKVEWYRTTDGISGYSVFTNTPWHIIFFFLLLYIITTICYCFMISVFFSKANTAATVAGLMWFLSFSPYIFLSNGRTMSPFVSRLLGCFASNTAMSFGFEIIMNHEAAASGLRWSTLWDVITEDDPLVMGHVLVMLVADAFIYLLIALYVEQVLPGSYGVPRPWYFIFTKSFWSSAPAGGVRETEASYESDAVGSHSIEPDPKDINVGVHIINLTKVYNSNVAVDKLNLKIFDGQITVILGHNGAGKTTTMSMLTGMITPTSGTALVAGHDIRNDISGVRASLGLCPQHNVLFPDLTVAEHIFFFAQLKGIQGTALKQQVDKYIRLLGLEDKRNKLSNTLSGGMKRRLSVGVALCGGSKVVLLDEPSSGIDPASRRELWDLLHADKQDRTIILTTHFMDEAEVLGERVAVMAGGKLRAVGSPFFLKRKFSVGYTLTAATGSSANNTSVSSVTTLIQSHIPQATLHSNIGSELSYHLPSEFSNKFESLLKELETRHTEYGLNSFGISAGSLEDVFMKAGADNIDITDKESNATANGVSSNGSVKTEEIYPEDVMLSENGNLPKIRVFGMALWRDQWIAMFYKRMVCTLRSWILTTLQIFIPVLFLVIAILGNRMFGLSKVLPPRELSLSNGYQNSETILSSDGTPNDNTLKRMEMYMKYFESYSSMKVVNIGNADLSDYYLEKAATNMADMRKRNLAAATFGADSIKVWFSNFAFHDLPASMMLVYNAITKAFSPNTSFTLTNTPLPYTMDTKINMLEMGDSAGFQLAFNIGFSMAFVSGFYILFYIKENVTRSKLLQLASGASPFIMWTSALLWDVACFIIISIALSITLLAFQEETFTTAVQIFRLLLLLLIFGISMLPMHYLISPMFQTPSTGFSRMVFFDIFTGVAAFLIVQVLDTPALELEHVAKVLHWIFLCFPHYTISNAILRHYEGYITKKYCYMACDVLPSISGTCNLTSISGTCNLQTMCHLANICPSMEIFKSCCIPEDPYFIWGKPGILPHIFYMIGCFIFFFTILLLREYKFIDIVLQRFLRSNAVAQHSEEEDSDVVEEKQRVGTMNEMEYRNHSLLCKNMSKKYKNFVAVNNLSFGVTQGECFGLLGMNGAGKTTTFKMLMGDLLMSSGEAWVNGYSVNNNMKAVYSHIGYCPQFDALLDEMTGLETLKMFAQLKGIPPTGKLMSSLSRKLGFFKHLNKKVREYSGGNKRKLSTAVALLGDPEVVYLDEPTTGMDPVAKRQVWRAIANRDAGCVVLTSHSMEECEALCTRIAIMVNGKFRCLGSTQHLKNKFSQGYTLIVKLRRSPSGEVRASAAMETLENFLSSNFPGAVLKEAYQGLVTYYLPDPSIPWSRIFGLLEEAKDSLDLEDYSVGQTSLEQIFLQFTQDQASTSL